MPNLKDPSLLRQQAFVGGAWCDADDGQTIAVTNPANGETVASVPHMGAAETKRAIDVERFDAGKCRRSGIADDAGTRQTTG
jgi:acyl-CoA reductase-like NAD-dependent aldehyde dehydrogenase